MTTEQIIGEQDGNPLFEAFDSWLWSACTCDTEVGWTCGAHKNAQPLRLALQDIMGLHKDNGGGYCVTCIYVPSSAYQEEVNDVEFAPFPCHTRQAITNRLGE